MVKHASSSCLAGSFDLHVLSWADATDEPRRYIASMGVFLLAPRSHGRVRVVSQDPGALPLVERGHLTCEDDLGPLLEGLELGRRLAATEPLRSLLASELRPGGIPLQDWIRQSVRNYFHPAGTCPIGPVVDTECRVHGVDGLVIADASVMPTIPRANTNLTTVAIAERVASFLSA
jgi:choline dehydrogenase